jgi:hypothetical protein
MRKIHFKFIEQMLKDSDVVKALALAIYVKMSAVSSTVNRCTVNKMHELTGLHSKTVKKRMKTLQKMGLLICDQNNNVTFLTLQSSCKKRNVLFDFTKYKSVSELEYALYSLLLKDILSKKEYMKKEIDEIKNIETPANASESRSIKSRIKKLRKNIYKHRNTTGLSITEEEYKEYGISYDTIARKLGVCRQKAVEIVKFALKYRLITRDKRVVQMHMKDVGICSKFVFPDGLPKGIFCTKDNIYKVFANIYHNVEAS